MKAVSSIRSRMRQPSSVHIFTVGAFYNDKLVWTGENIISKQDQTGMPPSSPSSCL